MRGGGRRGFSKWMHRLGSRYKRVTSRLDGGGSRSQAARRVPLTAPELSALRRTARRVPVSVLFLWVVVVALQSPCRESARSVSDWFRTPAFLFLSSPGETPHSGLFFVLEARRWWSEKFVRFLH